MAKLCAETPTPIALDEELIGVIDFEKNKIIGYEGRKIILLNLNHLQNLCA
jgi:L-alanine-DL-glutamate epimerase-like enolase superfamily enzyme